MYIEFRTREKTLEILFRVIKHDVSLLLLLTTEIPCKKKTRITILKLRKVCIKLIGSQALFNF